MKGGRIVDGFSNIARTGVVIGASWKDRSSSDGMKFTSHVFFGACLVIWCSTWGRVLLCLHF